MATASQQPPQGPPPAKATPKQPYDSRDAQIAWQKAQNAQLKINAATTQYQAAMGALQREGDANIGAVNAFVTKVRKDNGWGEDHIWDPESDQWLIRPPEPKPADVKPADPKPAEKK